MSPKRSSSFPTKLKLLKASNLALLLACLLVGCGTPSAVTPKPDIHPVAVSNQRIQAETKQVKTLTGKSRAVTTALQGDLNSGNVAAAKIKAAQLQQIADEVDKHVVTLEELGKGQEKEIVSLGGQIETAHKNEQVLGDWKKANESVIEQVNKYWGLGAFAYGAKVLARHLLVLSLVLSVAGVLLYFFAPAVFAAIMAGFRLVTAFVKRLFTRR